MAQPTLLAIAKADLISMHRHGVYGWGHDIRKLVLDARRMGIYVPDLIAEKADVITSWEANARYYPTKIIRRDVIVKVIREVQNWHKNLAKQGIR